MALCTWGTWALFAPAVLVLARRVPFERGGILRALAVHALAAAVVIAAKLWVDAQALGLALRRAPRISPTEIHMALLTYAALVAAVHVAALRRNARERELFASRLESRLAQAQLQELQAQLHPHFLFNTLHAISALVRSDPEAADRTIAALADLLRLSLQNRGAQEVPLRQEIDFVRRYLEIEQTRFRGRLEVAFAIDSAALDGRLPALVIQPLVENAIRHGISPRVAKGFLRIAAARREDTLCVEVEDDGVGLPPGGVHEGVGLANTRARLEQLYGKGDRLTLLSREGGGVRALLRIPWQAAG